MEHQFKLAVFDLDGTLLDTSEGVLSSVRFTIEKFGLKMLDDDILRTFIGPPIQESFANNYNLRGDILQEIVTVFRDRYKTEDLLKARPYEGIYGVFDRLRMAGIKTAVATYKRQDYAVTILNHFAFDKVTDVIYGSDYENKLKKKDIIARALKELNITKVSDAVMIGDSDNDAIGAKAIGMKFVGVTYGFGFRMKEDVNQFDSIGAANSTGEIAELILGGRYEN